MSISDLRILLYRKSRAAEWVFIGVSAFLVPCVVVAMSTSVFQKTWLAALPEWSLALAVGLWIIFLGYVLALPAWHSIAFRHGAYWLSRRWRAFYRRMASSWMGVLTLVAIATMARRAGSVLRFWIESQRNEAQSPWGIVRMLVGMLVQPGPLMSLLEPKSLLTTVAGLLVLVIFYGAYKARKRIIIVPFDEYTGQSRESLTSKETSKDAAAKQATRGNVEGLACRLRSELASLTKLYKVVDEASPAWQESRAFGKERESGPSLSISAEDIGDLLTGAVSAESKVSVGPLVVPVGWLLASAARLVRGPRLSGSLHRIRTGMRPGSDGLAGPQSPRRVFEYLSDTSRENGERALDAASVKGATKKPAEQENKQTGDYLILIVELTGGGMNRNWRVESKDLCEITDQEGCLDEVALMLRLMAYRIFTDLARVGSPRWEAVRHFSEGLRSYRAVQRTGKDKRVRLREAERQFIEALQDDNQFAQCHYNLGVVYDFLGERESARAAFKKAIESSPASAKARLALAEIYRCEGDFHSCQQLCRDVIELTPSDAGAWVLHAYAQFKSLKSAGSRADYGCLMKEVVSARRIAMALSWRAICGRANENSATESRKRLALICAGDLARSLRDEGAHREAIRVCRQALLLAPDNPWLHFDLAGIFSAAGDWHRAADELDRIITQALDPRAEAKRWAYSWIAHSHVNDPYSEAAIASARSHLTDLIFTAGLEDPEYAQICIAAARSVLEGHRPQCSTGNLESGCAALELLLGRIEAGFYSAPEYRDFKLAEKSLVELESGRLDPERVAATVTLVEETINKLAHPQHRSLILRLHWRLAQALVTAAARRGILLARDTTCRIGADTSILRKALYHARNAVALNPEGSRERLTMGEVYHLLNDYKLAEEQLEVSAVLDSDPDTLFQTARAYHDKAFEIPNLDKRKKVLQTAIATLSRALHLVESESLGTVRLSPKKALALNTAPKSGEPDGEPIDESNSEKLAVIHYWLGNYHRELREYEFAIRHLKIARDFTGDDLLRVLALVRLGDAYRASRGFNDGALAYRAVIEKISPDRVLLTNGLASPLLDAHLGLAELHLAGGARPERAEQEIKLASALMEGLCEEERLPRLARLRICEGIVRLSSGDLTGAIESFLESVECGASVEACYYLAQAYAERASTPERQARDLQRSREEWDVACGLDFFKEYAPRIERLGQRLSTLEEKAFAATPTATAAVH